MKLLLLMLLPAVVVADPISIPSTWTPRERAAAAAVTAEGLASSTRFLADDLLEGRAPASHGDAIAMIYVASELERLGIKPAGDGGGWLQRFQLIGLTSKIVSPPTASGPGGSTLALHPPDDFIVAPGAQKESLAIDGAEIVFAGYGITAPEQHWDDFKDVDVRGKVLLVMNSDPERDPALFAGKTRLYYGRWNYKFEEAARKGAAGVILIHTTPSAAYPWQVVQTSWQGESFELPSTDEPRLQVKMWATEEVSRKLAALGGHDLDELRRSAESRDFHPVPLGIKLSVALHTEVRRLATANVLGLLPGSDPALSDEVVVISAHHDHLGIGAKKEGDGIYNGALDNASGVSALLAIADGMSRARPRRSVLFASVAAEESGLLGSQYLVGHTVGTLGIPTAKIAADINLDGVNIWGRTRDVSMVGLGKSSLDAMVRVAARQQGREVKPDPFPDRGSFYRSDQFNFARAGVPSIYLNAGMDFVGRPAGWGRERIDDYIRLHYHQPSDQIGPDWDWSGAVDDVRLLTVVGLRVADASSLPTWTPGDEFEAARKRALSGKNYHP